MDLVDPVRPLVRLAMLALSSEKSAQAVDHGDGAGTGGHLGDRARAVRAAARLERFVRVHELLLVDVLPANVAQHQQRRQLQLLAVLIAQWYRSVA